MVVKFTSSSIANGFFLATNCLSLHSTKSILCWSLYLLLFLCKFCSKGYTHWHIHCVFVCAEKSLHWIRPFTLLYMTKSRAFHAHTRHQMALINFKHPYSHLYYNHDDQNSVNLFFTNIFLSIHNFLQITSYFGSYTFAKKFP